MKNLEITLKNYVYLFCKNSIPKLYKYDKNFTKNDIYEKLRNEDQLKKFVLTINSNKDKLELIEYLFDKYEFEINNVIEICFQQFKMENN